MFRNIYFYGLICVLFSTITYGQDWKAFFDPPELIIHMNTEETAQLSIVYITLPHTTDNFTFHLRSEDTKIATVQKTIEKFEFFEENGFKKWIGNFTISAILVSRIKIYVTLETIDKTIERSESALALIVTRNNQPFDYILFVYAGLAILLLYIRVGAEFNFAKIRLSFKDSKSSMFGLLGQFIIMPVVGYLVGYLFFSDIAGLHLGMFFIMTCPIGAASELWIKLKPAKNDIDKSDTVTTVSTLTAFVMIPIWFFSMGRIIFYNANIEIPYIRMASLIGALIIAFITGILIQKFIPKIPKYFENLAKPKSISYMIFILAGCANSYIFQIHTLKIILAGFVLTLIGYILGFFIGIITQMKSISKTDIVYDFAVCIQLGMLNTGLAIFFLKFSLSQPETDQALSAAFIVSFSSCIIFLILFILQCIWDFKKSRQSEQNERNEPVALPLNNSLNTTQVNQI